MTEPGRPEGKCLGLRGHHIFCVPFLDPVFGNQEVEFSAMEARIKQILRSGDKIVIEVVEGVDALCRLCPFCRNLRCDYPDGDEPEVRKFDAILLKGLDLKIGERLSARDVWARIVKKTPLPFCQRCRWRTRCEMGRRENAGK